MNRVKVNVNQESSNHGVSDGYQMVRVKKNYHPTARDLNGPLPPRRGDSLKSQMGYQITKSQVPSKSRNPIKYTNSKGSNT